MARGAGIRLQTGASRRMSSILGEWRESKVRPIPGHAPHDRPVSRGMVSPRSTCDDSFHTTRFPQLRILPRRSVGVFKAWRNLSGPIGFENQNRGWDRTASRWSAPGPGQRTCREDHALSHRPQMSSGRLFLDRVARQQSPSPLHRQPEHNTHPAKAQAKGDISTLPGGRLIRPISARYSGGLSLRASETILVNRLESRSRQFLEGPSGRDRRNISIAC